MMTNEKGSELKLLKYSDTQRGCENHESKHCGWGSNLISMEYKAAMPTTILWCPIMK